MSEVLGRIAYLSDGRIVFIGTKSDRPGRYYIGFRNAEGYDTKLSLSKEALDMLVKLRQELTQGLPLGDFPHKMVWQQVDKKA